MNPVTREQRDEAIAHFKYEGTLVKDCPYGSGHINDTFLLIFEIAEMGRIKVILSSENIQQQQQLSCVPDVLDKCFIINSSFLIPTKFICYYVADYIPTRFVCQ